MKRFRFSTLLWLAALLSPLHAIQPAGKTQQLTSPDQVPEGLAKSDWGSIRAAYEAGRHAFQPTPTGWQARNPGQQWTTSFDRRGFVATPKAGGWTWGLELQGYGFGNQQQMIAGIPAVQAQGSRLTYQWDAAVQEWFVNDQRGLEHGFTVSTRPAADTTALTAPGAQPTALSFLLAVRGELRPHVTTDALGVEFRDATGATVLNYAGLKVWDADGKILTSHFELAASSPSATGEQHAVRLLVDERGARYPITIDPIAQQAYLKASNPGVNDFFGYSVSLSGDTVVVGAYAEDSSTTGVDSTPNELATASGAAYVFIRSGTTWSQQAYLKASNTGASDYFGISVAVSGDTVVVGAYGEDSSTTGVDSTPNESATDAGAAYVFTRSGTTWSQQAYLKASNPGVNDQFGYAVGVSGDTVVVGAYLEDSNTTGVDSTSNESATDSGAAYVFTRSGTTWSQQAYLKASNTGAGDSFGWSVAVSGDTVVVGANNEDSSTTGVDSTPNESASGAGAAYVFTRSGTTWSQQAYLKASQVTSGDYFGYSVAVSGDTVVVGARYEDSSTTGVDSTPNEGASLAGAAYVFTRSGTTWTQQAYLKASNTGGSDYFGRAVAVSGDTVVVGASFEDSGTTGVNSTPNESASAAGAAYVFVRSGTTWTEQAYLKASNTGVNDYFGVSVAVSGDTVVVGANQEDSSTTGANSTSNESAGDSGAAYVFTGLGVATVTTPTSASIAATSATLGGDVTSAATITATGIVYAPTASNNNPQIGGTGVTTVAGSGTTGVFTVTASGLTADTAYTYAAYATTSAGTTYSSTGTFTTVNVAPTLAAITDPAAILEEAGAQTVNLSGITAGGGDTQVLTVTAASSNTGLIPNPTVTYTSAGTTGSLSYTPVADANGTAVITVTVTDNGGTANSGVATTTRTFTVAVTAVNDAPVAGADTLTRPDSTRVTKVLLTTLLANDTDPENDTLSITAVGSALPTGSTVSISGAFVVYIAPVNTAGNGSFTYTLSDGTASVTSTVTVTETSSSAAAGSPNSVSLVQSGSDYVLKFLGVPGRTYGVQYTTATGLPYTWNEFPSPVSRVAPDSGVMSYTDVNPPDPIRFYRAVLLQ